MKRSFKRRISASILATMMTCGVLSTTAHAETEVEINETNFPDAAFREVVKEFDENNDGILSESEINNVEDVDCYDRNIADLSGIHYFSKMTFLDCGSNNLTNLDLRFNTALTHLECGDNELSELDLQYNTDLVFLKVENNRLNNLNVSNNTLLETLDCSENNLTSLDLSQNTVLEELSCSDNKLAVLDLSGNTSLRYFNSSNTFELAMDVTNDGGKFVVDLAQLASKFGYAGFNTNNVTMRDGGTLTPDGKVSYDTLPDRIQFDYDTKAENADDRAMEIVIKIPAATVTTYYSVTINPSTNGTVTANQTSNLTEGELVTLTLTAAKGYTVRNVIVTDEAANIVPMISENTFKMPASNVTVDVEFSLVSALALPTITKGDGQTYTKGSGKTIEFTCDGDITDFKGLEIDGITVDASMYTAVSGSTIATLKNEYLESLADGEHWILFVYELRGLKVVSNIAHFNVVSPKPTATPKPAQKPVTPNTGYKIPSTADTTGFAK